MSDRPKRTATAIANANIAFIKYVSAKLGRTYSRVILPPKTLADGLFASVFPQYLASQQVVES